MASPVGRILTAVLLLSLPVAAADGDSKDEEPLRDRGFGYLGAFFVTNIETTVGVFASDNPLGARINLSRDLGFDNSVTVPRAAFTWRFGQRHVLGISWYRLQRESEKTLSTVIPLPPGEEFPVNITVDSVFKTDITKLQYTWLFHNDRKVSLGLGAGLFVAGLDLTIDGDVVGQQQTLRESVTAPLPVFGLRLTYRLSPKMRVAATSDWFLLKYGDYAGVLNDTQIYFNHRTFKHVGFAGGINIQTTKIEILDDKLIWELDEGFLGFLVAVTFHI